MIFPIVLVRFSEIALKSRNTRMSLRRLLRHNVLAAMKINNFSVEKIEDTWDRLIVYATASDEVAQAVSKVFGVVSTSPAIECKGEIYEITKVVSEIALETLKEGDSFAIRVRRVGKHEFTTYQIASACGSLVLQTAKEKGIQVHVDLDSPDHEIFVEVRDERGFVYESIVHGVGGLPLGSQGRVVSLLRDYDSIIATWLVMKRGCLPILVLFNGKGEFEELVRAAKTSLSPYTLGEPCIIVVPLAEVIQKISSQSLLRSLEYLTLNDIALLEKAEGIVSSERSNPSSSDELKRLRDIADVVQIPVFYPLIGLGEEDLNRLANTLGVVSRSRDKTGTNTTRVEETNHLSTMENDSYLKQYRERIWEVVTAAVQRKRI
jgi:thiamine biosynthesis protein ThiI